mmetsp:Transcript_21046/g.43902  ORF Transcript_21046/g.43902 Transcript_21046/m.43902 type:complete len:103 (+) Transcript_21046:134-442(+)
MSLLHRISSLFSQQSATSGSVAKERLSLIIASQRGSNMLAGVDMTRLQSDVMEIVKRHISVAEGKPVNFQVKSNGNTNLFEIQVEMDENSSSGKPKIAKGLV